MHTPIGVNGMSDPIHWNAGDYHRWERPEGPPCPDCKCCTALLCQTAGERGLACSLVVEPGPDVMDVSSCPCPKDGAAAGLAGWAGRTRSLMRDVGRGNVIRFPGGETRRYSDDGTCVRVNSQVGRLEQLGLVRLGGVVTSGPYKPSWRRSRLWQLTRTGQQTLAAAARREEGGQAHA